MTTKIINKNDIVIPDEFAALLSGNKTKISKTKDGILISSVEEAIKKTRGILKGVYGTEEYFRDKKEEKKLEN